jgi:hypothetical protein
MSVTKKDIQIAYNVAPNMVEQIASKQLFIVDTSYLGRLLVSYKTTIGAFHNGLWVITSKKYSRQVNQFIESTNFEVVRIDRETFDDLLMSIGNR